MIKQILKLFHRSTTHGQMIRYGLVAIIGLIIDFSVVIFAKEVLNLYYLLAVCCGFIMGLIVTYVLSNRLVFGAPKGNKKILFGLFLIIGLIGLGILNFLMWILVSKFLINYIIAKCLATIVVFMWNFFARRGLYSKVE